MLNTFQPEIVIFLNTPSLSPKKVCVYKKEMSVCEKGSLGYASLMAVYLLPLTRPQSESNQADGRLLVTTFCFAVYPGVVSGTEVPPLRLSLLRPISSKRLWANRRRLFRLRCRRYEYQGNTSVGLWRWVHHFGAYQDDDVNDDDKNSNKGATVFLLRDFTPLILDYLKSIFCGLSYSSYT